MSNENAGRPSHALHHHGSAGDGYTSVHGFASIREMKTCARAEGLSDRSDEAPVTDVRGGEIDIDILAR